MILEITETKKFKLNTKLYPKLKGKTYKEVLEVINILSEKSDSVDYFTKLLSSKRKVSIIERKKKQDITANKKEVKI